MITDLQHHPITITTPARVRTNSGMEHYFLPDTLPDSPALDSYDRGWLISGAGVSPARPISTWEVTPLAEDSAEVIHAREHLAEYRKRIEARDARLAIERAEAERKHQEWLAGEPERRRAREKYLCSEIQRMQQRGVTTEAHVCIMSDSERDYDRGSGFLTVYRGALWIYRIVSPGDVDVSGEVEWVRMSDGSQFGLDRAAEPVKTTFSADTPEEPLHDVLAEAYARGYRYAFVHHEGLSGGGHEQRLWRTPRRERMRAEYQAALSVGNTQNTKG